MNLQQYLETLNGSDLIRVGSYAKFFFCGTVDEFYQDCDAIHHRYLMEYKRLIRELERKKKNYTHRKTEKKIIVEANRLKELKKSFRDIKIPFLRRNVIDHYAAFSDDSEIIIIEGVELGLYMDKEEYSKSMKCHSGERLY